MLSWPTSSSMARPPKEPEPPWHGGLLARWLRRSTAVIIAKLTLSVKELYTLPGRFERRGVAGWTLFRQSPVLRVLYYADDLCWMKATMSRSTWTR
jgi:hypothetical protein